MDTRRAFRIRLAEKAGPPAPGVAHAFSMGSNYWFSVVTPTRLIGKNVAVMFNGGKVAEGKVSEFAGRAGACLNALLPPDRFKGWAGFPRAAKPETFITAVPACPKDIYWSVAQLDEMISDLVARYPVDADRIYMAGHSMGGSGCREMLAAFPDRFAGMIVCAAGRTGAGTGSAVRPPECVVFRAIGSTFSAFALYLFRRKPILSCVGPGINAYRGSLRRR